MSEHIVKSYDEDLSQLKTMLAQMGGLVEQQLDDAIDAEHARTVAVLTAGIVALMNLARVSMPWNTLRIALVAVMSGLFVLAYSDFLLGAMASAWDGRRLATEGAAKRAAAEEELKKMESELRETLASAKARGDNLDNSWIRPQDFNPVGPRCDASTLRRAGRNCANKLAGGDVSASNACKAAPDSESGPCRSMRTGPRCGSSRYHAAGSIASPSQSSCHGNA